MASRLPELACLMLRARLNDLSRLKCQHGCSITNMCFVKVCYHDLMCVC